MRGVPRPALRSRMAVVIAGVIVLTILAAAVLFHGTLFAWTTRGDNQQFLAVHVASMRGELARVHRGKVDYRTMQRILEMQAESADAATTDQSDSSAVASAIAHHLAGDPENNTGG